MVESVLDSLSSRLTGIITPVSITMALTVWLVPPAQP